MSVIPITITWDADKGKIVGVEPDPVRLTWLNNDIAEFVLSCKGDGDAKITDIWFDGKNRQGPFSHLASTPYTNEKAWTGSGLAHVTQEYKYSVKVAGTNGEDELDPRMQVEDGP